MQERGRASRPARYGTHGAILLLLLAAQVSSQCGFATAIPGSAPDRALLGWQPAPVVTPMPSAARRAVALAPYALLPAPSDSGGCGPPPLPAEPAHELETLAAPGRVVRPTPLTETPDSPTALVHLAMGTPVQVEAWAQGADGRVRYRVAAEGATGWAAPGAVVLQAADPVTRQVAGRPIVEPLRGKGMWFIPDSRQYGVAAGARVAAAARANGLSHLYVEVATSRGGFWGAAWLDELLPAACAAGVQVIGSVFAHLEDLAADLALALQVAHYRTPDGLALAGLTVDMEETLVPENIQAFGELLRHHVGDDYLLVATVYPPESSFAARYPWPALPASWNAVAPMTYWQQMENRSFTPAEVYAYIQRNLAKLRALTRRPDLPVEVLGQLFQMGYPRLLGPAPPTAAEILAAAKAARDAGAIGISFFDWARATPAHWEALAALDWAG